MPTTLTGIAMLVITLPAFGEAPTRPTSIRARVLIETPLTLPNTPLDPKIDFPKLIRQADAAGVLNPNSIEVRNLATGDVVPHALTEDFAYSNAGRIEWVVGDPEHREFEIRFRTAAERPPVRPQDVTPQIGTGDLLRYNAGSPRPITIPYSPGLHDLNGDGRLDLTGVWNYAHRPGQPWDGVVCFPHTGNEPFQFGDMARLRVVAGDDGPQFLSHTYMGADFADTNGDGRLDLVVTRRGTSQAEFFLNTGRRDPGGLPLFEPAGTVAVPGWQVVAAVDLNGDSALDLVVDGEYVRNESPAGWPFEAASAVKIDAGQRAMFADFNADGLPDSICMLGGESVQPDFFRVAWRRNLGGDPPQFGEEQLLPDIAVSEISAATPWHDGERSGLIVQHTAFEQIAFYELTSPATADDAPRFERIGRAESESAVISLSDQAWAVPERLGRRRRR